MIVLPFAIVKTIEKEKNSSQKTNIHKPEASVVLPWELTEETPGKPSELDQHGIVIYLLPAPLTS